MTALTCLLALLCAIQCYAGTSFDVSTLDGSNGVTINGAAAGANIGSSLANAGDIEVDGLDDLLIGAAAANEAYLFYASSFSSSPLSASDLDGSVGVLFPGLTAGDELGTSVRGGGDFNDDGFTDLLISAPGAFSGAGAVYIIFGPTLNHPFDLSLLDGSNGLVYRGTLPGDRVGESLEFADMNGDGIDDMIAGAPAAGVGGEVHVLYGNSSWSLALVTAPSLNGFNGAILEAGFPGMQLGASLCGLSDLNDDSNNDLAMGAPGASVGGLTGVGVVQVVYGGAPFTHLFNVSSVTGADGFSAQGGEMSGFVGDRALACGADFSGDGLNDLAIGAWGASGGTGDTFVLYAVPGGPPAVVDLISMPAGQGIELRGETFGDQSGSALALGDSQVVGQGDLLIGSPGSTPGTAHLVQGPAGAGPVLLSNIDGGAVDGIAFPGISSGDAAGTAAAFIKANSDSSSDAVFSSPFATAGGNPGAGQVYVVFGYIPTATPSPTITTTPTATTTATSTPTTTATATATTTATSTITATTTPTSTATTTATATAQVTPLPTVTAAPEPGWIIEPQTGTVDTLFSFIFFDWESLPNSAVLGYNVNYRHDGIDFKLFSDFEFGSTLFAFMPAGEITATGVVQLRDESTGDVTLRYTESMKISVRLPEGDPDDILQDIMDDIVLEIADENIDEALQDLVSITTLLLPEVDDIEGTIADIIDFLEDIANSTESLTDANTIRFTYVTSKLVEEIQDETLIERDVNLYLSAVSVLTDFIESTVSAGSGIGETAAQLSLQTVSYILEKEELVESTTQPFFDAVDAIIPAAFIPLPCNSNISLSANEIEVLLSTHADDSIEFQDSLFGLPKELVGDCQAVAVSRFTSYPFGALCSTRQDSDVFSLSIHDGDSFAERDVQNLEEPVVLSLPVSQPTLDTENSCNKQDESVEFSCVFFDRESGCWSDKGCQAVESGDGSVSCECTHLTDFSVLTSVKEGGGNCDTGSDAVFTPIVVSSLTTLVAAIVVVSSIIVVYQLSVKVRSFLGGSEAARVEKLRVAKKLYCTV